MKAADAEQSGDSGYVAARPMTARIESAPRTATAYRLAVAHERTRLILGAGTAAAVGGLAGGILVAWLRDGSPSSNVVTASSTVVLVGVTAAYVNEVRRHRMDDTARWATEQTERKHEQSRSAATRAREAIFDSQVRPGAGTPETVVAECPRLWRSLEHLAPLIDDAELRDRMRAVQVMTWMATWSDSALATEEIDIGLLSLHVRHAVEKLNDALGRHLTDEPLQPWEGLPGYAGAQRWVWDYSKPGCDPPY